MSFAAAERTRLRDLLVEVGPDAPTLCEGWLTRDLAAHLYIRERRLDAVGGNWISVLKPRLDKVTAEVMQRPYADVVHEWGDRAVLPSPIDALINTAEHFVHHEDVRRCQPDWQSRELEHSEQEQLYGAVKRMARLLVRGASVPVIVEPQGFPRFVATNGPRAHGVSADGSDVIRVTGPVGEVALWLFGRTYRGVTVAGEESAIAALNRSV